MEAFLLKENVESCEIDVSRFSDMLDGRIYFFFIKNKDGKLMIRDESKKIVLGKYPLKLNELFDNYQSIGRITVNGIRMNLKKIGSIYNNGSTIVNYLIDIEVRSSSKITYDVSRDRIIGKGIYMVRGEIFKVVRRFLKQTGTLDKFSESDRDYFEKNEYHKMPARSLNESICRIYC